MGILTRPEAEAFVAGGPPPKMEPVKTCSRSQSIRDLQRLLLESTTQFVVVVDDQSGKVVGVVTLHDLLRAEESMAQHTMEEL